MPRPENLLSEIEDDILEDIYKDIDRINSKIKYAQVGEIGGIQVHPAETLIEENPELGKTIVKQSYP